MPQVTVFDMTGKSVVNHGNRKVQDVQDRVPQELHSGHTAVSLWVRSQEITATSCQRKLRDLL